MRNKLFNDSYFKKSIWLRALRSYLRISTLMKRKAARINGRPYRTQTCDTKLRRLMLFSTELTVHKNVLG